LRSPLATDELVLVCEDELSFDDGEVKYFIKRSRSMGVSVLERLTASIFDAVRSSRGGFELVTVIIGVVCVDCVVSEIGVTVTVLLVSVFGEGFSLLLVVVLVLKILS
jgi:hypothetical protein